MQLVLGETPSRRKAVFVLGMHRSGTSAMAGLLNIAGLEMGKKFIETTKDNEKGFFENKEVVEINEAVLAQLGLSWDATLLEEDGWWRRPEFQNYKDRITALIKHEFYGYNDIAIKDPRLTRVLPLWLEEMSDIGIDPEFIIMLRPFEQVAASLEKRDAFSKNKSLLLWTIYNLEAEKFTRNFRRSFIKYEDLLNNWQENLSRIFSNLEIKINLTKEMKTKADNFLSRDLMHNKNNEYHGEGKFFELAVSTQKLLNELHDNPENKQVLAQVDGLWKELELLLSNNPELQKIWLHEAVENRKKMGKAYEELHKRNLTLHEKELEIIKQHNEIARFERQRNELESLLSNTEEMLVTANKDIKAILNSTSWRLTAPLRIVKKLFMMRRVFIKPEFYKRIFFVLRHNGFKGMKEKIMLRLSGKQVTPELIDQWYRTYQPSPKTLMKFIAFEWPANAPKFSLIMCAYNTNPEWLKEMLDSVLSQTYTNWELIAVNDASTESQVRTILDEYAKKDKRVKAFHLEQNSGVSKATNFAIKKSSGDYLAFIDHDDFLEPQALHRFTTAVLEDGADVLYSDEALTYSDIYKIRTVAARPQFSYQYYLSNPYFVHFIAVKKTVAEKAGLLDENLKVSHDYDFMLRVFENSEKVTHVPDILYRWRTHDQSLGHDKKDLVLASSMQALKKHLARKGYSNAEVKPGVLFNFFDIEYNAGKETKVAVIIPTKNRGDLLKTCINSLIRTTDRKLFDIYVVNHDSDEAETIAYLKELEKEHTVLPYSGAFNFSKIINHGIRNAKGNYTHYLILNNDIEAVEPGWLEHMVNLSTPDDVGVVGATLLYPNRVVQHAGVIVGICGAAEHSHKFYKLEDAAGHREQGFNGSLAASREYSAVTAACLLVKREALEKINGMDEDLAVGFGDTDFCLRIHQAGYNIINDAQAVLIHHESLSRGKSEEFVDPHPVDSKIFINRYRDIIMEGDPYYSPHLFTGSGKFELKPMGYSAPEKIKSRTVKIRKN